MNPKECKVMRPRLQRFADGEIQIEEANLVRSHLLDCVDCRAIVGEVYASRKFFSQDQSVQIPSGFASRVAALAFASGPVERTSTPLLPFVQILVAVAASLLLVVGSFLIWRADWMKKGRGVELQAGTLSDLDREIENLHKSRLKVEGLPKK